MGAEVAATVRVVVALRRGLQGKDCGRQRARGPQVTAFAVSMKSANFIGGDVNAPGLGVIPLVAVLMVPEMLLQVGGTCLMAAIHRCSAPDELDLHQQQ